MEIKIIDAGQLSSLKNNPRKTIDPTTVDKLKHLISVHGFQNPLQVWQSQGKNVIICGNHRFAAGVAIGMTEFPCVIYEGSYKQAIARAISDNKSSDWTEWDIPRLKDMFAEIDDGDFNYDDTGFNENEISKMFDNVKEIDFSPISEDAQSKLDEVKKKICPKCGHSW